MTLSTQFLEVCAKTVPKLILYKYQKTIKFLPQDLAQTSLFLKCLLITVILKYNKLIICFLLLM